MKKFLSIFMVLVAVFTLAACNGGNKYNGGILSPDEIDPNKSIEISFWHAMGQDNQAVIQAIAEKFSAEMKAKYGVNVTVVQTSQGDYTTLRKSIATAIAAGDQPTIAQTYADHVALYLEGDAVCALDDYISHSEYGLEGNASDSYGYLPQFWAEGSVYDKKGTIYSIPFNKSTEVLYYNKNIFEKYKWEVPSTWEEIVTICEAWKQTTEYQKLIADGKNAAGLGIDSEANLFITLLQQYGGQYTGFNEKGEGVYLFDNPQTKEALNWLLSEFNKGDIVTTTYFGTNYCSDAFKAQQCVMTIGSSAGAGYNIASDESFVTGVTAYPQRAGAAEKDKYVIQQGTNVSLLECQDKQEELFGWLFIKYLTNYESSLYWTLNTSYFPIRTDVILSNEYQEYISQMIYDNQGNGVKVYDPTKEVCVVGFAQSDYYYTSVAFPGSSKARDEATLIIQEILYNQTQYTIDSAIRQALKSLEND